MLTLLVPGVRPKTLTATDSFNQLLDGLLETFENWYSVLTITEIVAKFGSYGSKIIVSSSNAR